jgi:hypothetical protein
MVWTSQPTRAEHNGPLRGGQCECASCNRRFLNVRAFDSHRTGTYGEHVGADRRRCRTKDELRALGMYTDERDLWRFPIRAYSGPTSRAGSSRRRLPGKRRLAA